MKKVVLPIVLAGGVILAGGHDAFAVSGKAIVDKASQFKGTPYVYGSTSGSTSSFDCSSFTQLIYKVMTGISLPRTAAKQATVGVAVSQSNLKLGDLLFFNTTGKPASHVGIYVGGGQMISAESGYGVHVTGVFSGAQSSYWKPLFEQARRVIGYIQPAAASYVSKSVSASSTSSSGTKTYSVKSGDTLWGISRHYGVSVSAIKSLNHLSSDTIYAGQKLSLNTAGQKSAAVSHSAKVSKKVATSTGQSSAKSSYKVHKGDSLWEIATLHGITVNKLMKANNLSSTIIYPGMKLILPN